MSTECEAWNLGEPCLCSNVCRCCADDCHLECEEGRADEAVEIRDVRMNGQCVCGAWDCDGYNGACWDAEVRRLQTEGAARQNKRDRKERAVIDAAREWSTHVVHFRDTGEGYLNVVDAAQEVIDAVRALDES